MRARIIVAAVLVGAALAVVASTASGGTAASNSITVWLQMDAQGRTGSRSSRPRTPTFQREHPGVAVNVQFQTWGNHLQKFDADLAGGNAPGRHRDGQHRDDEVHGGRGVPGHHVGSASRSRTRRTWLDGLAAAGTVRRQALRRPVLRGLAGRHLPHRPLQEGRDQGARRASRSSRRPRRSSGRAEHGEGLLARLHRRHRLVRRDELRRTTTAARSRRQVSGKWKGTLASPKAIAGLTAYKNFFPAASRASKTTDETQPNPYDVYAQGQAGSMIGPGWFSCCVGDKYKATTGQFVMPSRTKGQPMPGFLGGSILAVPVGAQQVARRRLGQGLHEQRSR